MILPCCQDRDPGGGGRFASTGKLIGPLAVWWSLAARACKKRSDVVIAPLRLRLPAPRPCRLMRG